MNSSRSNSPTPAPPSRDSESGGAASPEAAAIEAYLGRLESILDRLANLQEGKRGALARLDVPTIERLTDAEGDLTADLVAAVNDPLVERDEAGQPLPRSLRTRIEDFPEIDRQRIHARLRAVRDAARRLQDDASSNWLAMYRTHQHIGQLLEIIARAGRPSGGPKGQGAGLMLDSQA